MAGELTLIRDAIRTREEQRQASALGACDRIAAELRRLREENARLRETVAALTESPKESPSKGPGGATVTVYGIGTEDPSLTTGVGMWAGPTPDLAAMLRETGRGEQGRTFIFRFEPDGAAEPIFEWRNEQWKPA